MKQIQENLTELLEVFDGNGVPNNEWVKNKLEETLKLVNDSLKVEDIDLIVIPDFISEITCRMVVELWNTPNVNNSNPRVRALELIKSDAKQNGFNIYLKKMGEIKDLILDKYQND